MSQNSIHDAAMSEGPDLLFQLRKSISDGKKSWMRLLDNQQLIEVYARLKKGDSMTQIINTVRETWGIRRNQGTRDLLPELVQFRMSALKDTALVKVAAQQNLEGAVELQQKLDAFSEKLDGIGRMGWLINRQTERVNRAIETEKKIGLASESTTKAVNVLSNMIEKYLKLQMESGLIDRAPSETLIRIHNTFDQIRENTLAGDGNAMIQATLKLIDLAEERGLTLVKGADGKYSAKPDELLVQQEEQTDIETSYQG